MITLTPLVVARVLVGVLVMEAVAAVVEDIGAAAVEDGDLHCLLFILEILGSGPLHSAGVFTFILGVMLR
jgi:hypothetical protein